VGNFHLLKDSSDMTAKASRSARRLREPGLLATERREDFVRLRKEFRDEIEPSCTTERLYVDWVASLTWEIFRFHRIKAELINGALFDALTNLLEQVLPADEFESSYSALPELVRLTRYERRAAGRRERAIRRLTQSED
jgi:hypothetical protein